MADDLLQFPRGQCAFAGGNLQQCQNVKSTYANGAKLQSTLSANPAGVTLGNRTVEISGSSIVSEDGQERAWEDKLESGATATMRFKVPGGEVKAYLVVVSELETELTLEEGVKQTWKLVGKKVKS